MLLVRKLLILTHRYAGIPLSVLFVIWFASGIAMIYARDMPRLTPERRLQRLPALDLDTVRLSPLEAARRAEVGESPQRVVLLMVMGRPAYRFTFPDPVTVFADTGDMMAEVDAEGATPIAASFAGVPRAMLHYAGRLENADQWTIGERQRLPLHKFVVNDNAGTELYVSEPLGEVVVVTTSATRMLAWVAAIPHWLYFAPLRLNDGLWRQVVIWTSGLGTLLAVLGIVLGVVQLKPRRAASGGLGRLIPYVGAMRWHHVAGLIFGVFTATWVFSGLLSMDPLNWSRGSGGPDLRYAMSGGPLDLASYPALGAPGWRTRPGAEPIKEVELLRVHDEPYYLVRRSGPPGERSLVAASTLDPPAESFGREAILARIRAATPGVNLAAADMLVTYDAYYYSRDGTAALPVLRVKLDDADRTWLYIDPTTSQIVRRIHRLGRVERWLYNGFHSLDFSFWYGRRPMWDVGMIALSIGGLATSGIGMYVGFRRMYRAVRRRRA